MKKIILVILSVISVTLAIFHGSLINNETNNEKTTDIKEKIKLELDTTLSENEITETISSKARLEQAIISRVEYSIISVDESQVLIRLVSPNIVTIFEKAYAILTFDQETTMIEQQAALIDSIIAFLESGDYEMMENTIYLPYSIINGELKVDYSDEFVNAVYGGVFSEYVNRIE